MKYFTKMHYIGLLALLVALTSTACSSSPAGKQSSNGKQELKLADKEKPYIGFSLDTLEEERWYKDKTVFEEEVKKLGGQVKTLAANGNDDVQVKQAELLVEEGVDVLVVVPHNAEISAKIVEIAHKADVKVISYDRLIRNADVDYYISTDNAKVGELQAKEILKKATKGNFVYIGGSSSDNNAAVLREGTMKELQPYLDNGSIRLIYDQFTDEWSPKLAQQNMEKVLKENGNKVDAVIAANDGMAGGAINALSSAGLAGRVPVTGQDSELNAILRLIKGTQTMTIYKPIQTIASKAAELAIKVAAKEQISTDKTVENGKTKVPSILLEPILVTKDNIRETVIKDGYLSESDVFGGGN